jgi:hypothetical protein
VIIFVIVILGENEKKEKKNDNKRKQENKIHYGKLKVCRVLRALGKRPKSPRQRGFPPDTLGKGHLAKIGTTLSHAIVSRFHSPHIILHRL